MTRTGKRATHKTKIRNARVPRLRSLRRLTKTLRARAPFRLAGQGAPSHPAFGPKRTYSVEYSRRLSKVGAAGRCTSSAIELVVCPDNTQVPSRRLFIEIEYMAAQ